MHILGFYLWGLGVTFNVALWVAVAVAAALIFGAIVDKIKKRDVREDDLNPWTGLRIFGILAGICLLWPITWAGCIVAVIMFVIGEIFIARDLRHDIYPKL